MAFRTIPLEKIRRDLDDLVTILTDWGLIQPGDRLRELISRFDEIHRQVQQGTAKQLESRPDFEDLVWASVESIEFAETYAGLVPMNPKELAPLFEKVLEGPLHPGAELAGTTAEGRNTMFQLRLGAGLRGAGGEIKFEEPSDVNLNLATGCLLIECKRPFKGQNIRSNIEKARAQLKKNLDRAAPGTGGVVAISLSKVLNSGSRLFVADDPSGFRRLQQELIDAHKENSSDYDSLVDLRLTGILYHMYTPALVRDPRLITKAEQAVVYLSGPAVQTIWPIARSEEISTLLKRALSPEVE